MSGFSSDGLHVEVTMTKRMIDEIKIFLKSLVDNYDCDTGENGNHHYACRVCQAKRLLEEMKSDEGADIGIDGWPI